MKIYILGSLTEVEFSFSDQTGSFLSCSTVINGKSIIFGGHRGYPFKNQISLVEDCRLTRIGSLPFSFHLGACNTFQDSNGTSKVLLCFGRDGKSNCHRFLKCLKYYFSNWFLVSMELQLFQLLVLIMTIMVHLSGRFKMFQSHSVVIILPVTNMLKVFAAAVGELWEISHLSKIILVCIILSLSTVTFIYLVKFNIYDCWK